MPRTSWNPYIRWHFLVRDPTRTTRCMLLRGPTTLVVPTATPFELPAGSLIRTHAARCLCSVEGNATPRFKERTLKLCQNHISALVSEADRTCLRIRFGPITRTTSKLHDAYKCYTFPDPQTNYEYRVHCSPATVHHGGFLNLGLSIQ